MSSNVLILGTGPSAAYAWLACQKAGVHAEVWSSTPPRTDQAGAFFLHWVPEELERQFQPVEVQVFGFGDGDTYSKKQWGKVVPNSFPARSRIERWYDSRILQRVWEQVVVRPVEPLRDWDLLKLSTQYDFVFHTFPTTASYGAGTRRLVKFPVFTSQIPEPHPQLICYSGEADDPWIRMTQAFGRFSLEYPTGTNLPRDRSETIGYRREELRDIPPEVAPVRVTERVAGNIIPIGRFAKWERHQLSHQAYQEVLDTLSS